MFVKLKNVECIDHAELVIIKSLNLRERLFEDGNLDVDVSLSIGSASSVQCRGISRRPMRLKNGYT